MIRKNKKFIDPRYFMDEKMEEAQESAIDLGNAHAVANKLKPNFISFLNDLIGEYIDGDTARKLIELKGTTFRESLSSRGEGSSVLNKAKKELETLPTAAAKTAMWKIWKQMDELVAAPMNHGYTRDFVPYPNVKEVMNEFVNGAYSHRDSEDNKTWQAINAWNKAARIDARTHPLWGSHTPGLNEEAQQAETEAYERKILNPGMLARLGIRKEKPGPPAYWMKKYFTRKGKAKVIEHYPELAPFLS